ncbi:hypothetical protein DFA_00294 [Cavenderia fasciculata]|uniref:HTH CENPB-type domain-containing protein n=1 Tax=Cavenderia fasciculata TaxID=261658 RepID=F4PY56_CACFS|nr:uncharacterized protein DFA_00294 [Cavenderia fasciculata]EGG19716.1 hypothetical protein DFA_00294 [Cavenderia fasciculata]|eukprot:XP_004358010.1 hypothetical protein DFA_00294 [Cavenderia fasciculata]
MELSFILNQQQREQAQQQQQLGGLQHLQEIIHSNSFNINNNNNNQNNNNNNNNNTQEITDINNNNNNNDRALLNNSTEAVVETLLLAKYGKNPHGFNLNFNNIKNHHLHHHNSQQVYVSPSKQQQFNIPTPTMVNDNEDDDNMSSDIDENSPLNSLTEASAMASSPLSSPRGCGHSVSESAPVSPAYSFTSPFSPASSSNSTSCCNSPRTTTTSSATTTPTITSIVQGNKRQADNNQVVPKKELAGLKKPRKSYEVSKKLEILEEKLQHGMPYVVEKYHISRSIISRWLSNIEKYRSFNKKNLKKLHKGPKASFSVEQEQIILDQINKHKANGELVNGEVIKNIALQLSKQLNNNNFKASSGWLENFKNRHGLKA